ncbi:MAG: site-2 protease family protein [Aeromicrobium sp.]
MGRFGGIDLLIRPSLLLMAAVLVYLFAPRFASDNTTGAGTDAYVLAALFVLALYISVLVHEIAHVVLARRYRMPVSSITLHLLGGETAIEGESRSPAQEFWTSVVGPLTSLAIGAIAWVLARGMDGGNAHTVMQAVATVNILVGAINLVPGLPLDGGRVFRAIIWALTGNEATGIRAAAWVGRVVAVVAVAIPFIWLARGDDDATSVDLVLGLLIGWFLWTGAGQALRGADRTARLSAINARGLADAGTEPPADAPSLSADLSGVALLRAMAATPSDVYRLTESDGRTYGQLRAGRVDAAYREGHPGKGSV